MHTPHKPEFIKQAKADVEVFMRTSGYARLEEILSDLRRDAMGVLTKPTLLVTPAQYPEACGKVQALDDVVAAFSQIQKEGLEELNKQ